MTTACFAGPKEAIFEYIDIIDISNIGGNSSETSFGISTVDVSRLKTLFDEFIESGDTYVVVKSWDKTDGKEYIGFMDNKSGELYLLMVDGRIVAFGKAE